jgi:hypothetical protein
VYIKIKYPFWSRQPVYHKYDLLRSLTSYPFIINQSNISPITCYTNLIETNTFNYNSISPEINNKIIDLLLCNYIYSDKVVYTLTSNDLTSIMIGHEYAPLVSLYAQPEYIIDNSSNILSTQKKYIGCITSQSLHFYFLRPMKNGINNLTIYFWDHICMEKTYKDKQITRNLIQSHEFNQRINSPDIKVSLLKKENSECEGVVPLCKYTSYTYYIRPITLPLLPKYHVITMITKENIDLLYNFIIGLTKNQLFDIQTFYSLSSIISQIKIKCFYIYMLCVSKEVYSIYIFKDAFTYYENLESGNTINLIASVNNCTSINIFYTGFLHSLKDIIDYTKNKHPKKFEVLMIDNTSHNYIINDIWSKTNTPIFSTPTNYYLYNMYYPGSPIQGNKCLFII